MRFHQTIILGAGASGLMLASNLKGDIAIIDSNPKIGAKLSISGGGKCNITNKKVTTDNFYPNSNIVQKALDNFSPKDLLIYFEKRGLKYKIENQKYFCYPDAKALLDIFEKDTKHIKKYLNTKILEVKKDKNLSYIPKKEILSAKIS